MQRAAKHAWREIDDVLRERGILLDMRDEKQKLSVGEKPAWFDRVRRAHTLIRERIRRREKEVEELQAEREANAPPRRIEVWGPDYVIAPPKSVPEPSA